MGKKALTLLMGLIVLTMICGAALASDISVNTGAQIEWEQAEIEIPAVHRQEIRDGKVVNVTPLDTGNQNSYSDGSSSSSSDSSDSGALIYLLMTVIRYPILIPFVLIAGAVYVIYKKKNPTSRASRTIIQAPLVQDNTAAITSQIQAVDPAFSAEKFMGWSKEVFLALNTAWTKRDWAGVRPFESDTLFREHSQQLQRYITDGKINMIDRVGIKDVKLISFSSDTQYEYLTVVLRANLIDYVYEEATGTVTAGSKTKLWAMEYNMQFMRSKGVQSKTDMNQVNITNCPNCGAPTTITSAGQCEYCHSVITTGEYNWVLSSYTGKNLG